MTNTSYDVIVIGSGPGGTSCATLLQKRGLNTLLLEKGNFLGGKMYSVEKDGYAYDLFPHGQVPMIGNQFETIFAELGIADEFERALEIDDPREVITLAYRRKDWKEYRKVSQTQAMGDPEPFFKLFGMEDETDKANMLAIMTEMMVITPEELSKLDGVTMKEWLDQRDTPSELYNYMAFQANASLAEPIDLVSASEQVLIMQQIFLQGGGGQYKGGFGRLTNIMIREFEKNGGTVIKNNKVEQITVEERRGHRRCHRKRKIYGAGSRQLRGTATDHPETCRRRSFRQELCRLRQEPGAGMGLHQRALFPR